MADFIKGDLVCRSDWDDETAEKNNVGHVVGFCPGAKWVRVRTLDRHHRIWLKKNVHNVDADMKEGNHAEPIDTRSII